MPPHFLPFILKRFLLSSKCADPNSTLTNVILLSYKRRAHPCESVCGPQPTHAR